MSADKKYDSDMNNAITVLLSNVAEVIELAIVLFNNKSYKLDNKIDSNITKKRIIYQTISSRPGPKRTGNDNPTKNKGGFPPILVPITPS